MSTADPSEPRRPLARARRVESQPRLAERIEPEAPAPEVQIPTPGVVNCFRVFCTIVAFGAVIVAGCSFIPFSNDYYHYSNDFSDGIGECALYLALSLVIFTLFGIPLLFPRSKPWMWWYGLAIILISTLSLYLTIFGILLLIFWVQPRTQQFFGRGLGPIATPNVRRHDDEDFDD